jgi:hypothetical protein
MMETLAALVILVAFGLALYACVFVQLPEEESEEDGYYTTGRY